MTGKIRPLTLLLLLLTSFTATAKQPPVFPPKSTGPPKAAVAKLALPRGYDKYLFGTGRLAILAQVKKDPKLISKDADFIEGFEQEDWAVLVCQGLPWLRNVFFLFHEKKLFGVVVVFNKVKYSYPLLIRTLSKKYGRPRILGLNVTSWQNKTTRLQLEKGLRLKYLDLERFAQMKKNFNPKLLQKKLDKLSILKGL